MIDNNFTILKPRKGNCLFVKGPMVYTRDFPVKGENNYEGNSISKLGDRLGKKITQNIYKYNNYSMKENIVTKSNNPIYKNIQKIDNDGFYSSTRLIDEEIIGGYVSEPLKNKKLTGFKGFLEKITWSIANKKNGCERPFFNKIAGKVINKLRQVK